jgi:hypothetical protein
MDKRAQDNHSRPELARDLGLSHAGAVVVGTIIGSGIFLVPTEMMQAVGSARLVYLAWMVGGLLSFFGALTYAELGAMKPQAGGEYVYVRDAYGPLAGFLYSWTMVSDREAGFDCDHNYRAGADPRNFSGLLFFLTRLLLVCMAFMRIRFRIPSRSPTGNWWRSPPHC